MKIYTSPKEGIGLYCVFKTVDSGERLSIHETQTEETEKNFCAHARFRKREDLFGYGYQIGYPQMCNDQILLNCQYKLATG